jgi:hypothetical protein
MKITENFTWDEVTVSGMAERHGIPNVPPPYLIPAIKNTAAKMELVRAILDNKPITVNSWYRSYTVNKLVGSTNSKSQHTKGEAVDFVCSRFGSPKDLCFRLLDNIDKLDFDQMILEHSWVHISWKADPNYKNRRQVLTLLKNKKYAVGLTNLVGEPYERK